MSWFLKIASIEDLNMAESDFDAIRCAIKAFERNEALSDEDREVYADEAFIAVHRLERVVDKFFNRTSTRAPAGRGPSPM